ncbi:MAG: tetratricopeptide repeat protein [Caldilineaceae bacterium]|nr:tetratricopeptide repeat protein [Caldilineaceae bacterium]
MLRQRRQGLDLTRSELARRVGCSADMIKKLEEGERRPSKELAGLLAEHLQIDAATRATFIRLARARGALTVEAGPSNLPAPLTSFVGREPETVSIETLLRQKDVRLLTLVGSPGVGKSRLALHAAERLRLAFVDGVWFVPLAAVEEPQQVLLSIAQTLGIGDDGRQAPLDWLTTALRSRRMLLVLDNFEQVVEAAPLITALLTACAQVSALVTSRTPLAVYGEHQFVVPPLPVPPPTIWGMPDALGGNEAIQLFVARIRAHNPHFQLLPDNSSAVAELCARLDGLPLAIELAAGLTRAESPHLLLADIQHEGRLALLTTLQRDRSSRQQTLREAIAWSVRRLSPADQALFARLSLFQGTFDLAAAYAVAGVANDPSTSVPVAEFTTQLQILVAGHLVQLQRDPATNDPARYGLLETLREYALEILRASEDHVTTQCRHAHYYAALAFAMDPAQSAGNVQTWRGQLRSDYPNLMAALHFALAIKDVELTLKLANGLGHYWYLEGSWQEGANWLEQALTLPGGQPAVRSRVQTALGILCSALGRYAEAERHLTQAREEATTSGDLLATAWTLSQLSQLALLQGQTAVTRAYTHERLQVYRRLGDIRYLALTLEQMGCAAIEEGDYARGLPWLEECQVLWAKQGSRAGMASVDLIVGMADLAQDNATMALMRFQRAYAEFDAIEHSHGLPWSLRNLGLAHLALGQVPQAQFHLQHSLERYIDLANNSGSIAVIVEAGAGIATRLGQHHMAAHLMGAAATARTHVGMPITVNSRQIYDRLLGPSIKALGMVGWEKAVAIGSMLPWGEAVSSTRSLLTLHPDNKTAAAPSK